MAELFLERIHAAHEAVRGTAVTTPTHVLNMDGVITDGVEYQELMESRGELASVYAQDIAKTGAALTLNGAADVNYMPFLANLAVAPEDTPTTPSGATLARLWTFIPNLTEDDILSMTAIWDLSVQSQQSKYLMADNMVLANDVNSMDGLTAQISLAGHLPTDVATPTPAANIAGAKMQGIKMQWWLDTSSAIGTTERTATYSVVTAQHTFTTGVTYKPLSAGPLASLDFAATGRDKSAVRCVTNLQVEMPGMALHDIFRAGTVVKCRVRHNGALIDTTTGPVNWYNYCQIDTYGVLKFTGWGVNQNSNRTANYTIESIKDATLGAGYQLLVQNARDTL